MYMSHNWFLNIFKMLIFLQGGCRFSITRIYSCNILKKKLDQSISGKEFLPAEVNIKINLDKISKNVMITFSLLASSYQSETDP